MESLDYGSEERRVVVDVTLAGCVVAEAPVFGNRDHGDGQRFEAPVAASVRDLGCLDLTDDKAFDDSPVLRGESKASFVGLLISAHLTV